VPASTDRNVLGGVLFTVLALVGFALAARARRGVLATAGVVLGAGAVPLALGFFTFDLTSGSGGFPFNLDAVTWLSIVVWAAAYLFVPGFRGHTFLVFLVADLFYSYVLLKSAQSDFGVTVGSALGGGGPQLHGLGTVAAVSLIFGLAYYAVAYLLDARGQHGPATGLIFPAFSATLTGVVASGHDLKVTGAAVVGLILSVVLCWYGARFGRRFTAFVWAAGAAVSVVVVLADNVKDGIPAGIVLLVIGVAFVAVAALLAATLREPDDMDTTAAVRSR
jgi:hypothetical protein